MTPGLTSVIVVAADSGRALLDCAASVVASTAPFELIVSDNGSSDDSVDALRAAYVDDPRVRVLANGRNLGFGPGVNRAAVHALGDVLLLLNPDCVIDPTAIAVLRAHLATDARIGALGVRLVGDDGREEPAARRRDPTLRRTLMSLTGLARWESRRPSLAGVNLPVRRGDNGLEVVDALSGAAMMVPRAAFDRVGGFDETYFLHCEDLDLCRTLRDHGYLVCYAGDVTVRHAKGGSSRHRPVFVARHKHRGMWRWFRKHDPAARNPLLRAVVFAGLWTRFALQVPLLLLRKR